MQPVPQHRMTVDEFLLWHEQQETKYELVEGRPVTKFAAVLDEQGRPTGMAGGTFRHADIAANILVALRQKLAGTACQAIGSDLAVRISDDTTRLPDVSIFCDAAELAQAADKLALERPRVVFEVHSPSSERQDKGDKLADYKSLPSIQTIVLVSHRRGTLDVYERMGELEWRNVTRLRGSSLTIRDPAVTLTAAEIFGSDPA